MSFLRLSLCFSFSFFSFWFSTALLLFMPSFLPFKIHPHDFTTPRERQPCQFDCVSTTVPPAVPTYDPLQAGPAHTHCYSKYPSFLKRYLSADSLYSYKCVESILSSPNDLVLLLIAVSNTAGPACRINTNLFQGSALKQKPFTIKRYTSYFFRAERTLAGTKQLIFRSKHSFLILPSEPVADLSLEIQGISFIQSLHTFPNATAETSKAL